jgi:hypothetical protein
LHRRGGGYLTVVLLIGVVGGTAMGAVAGARRTQSAFPAYMSATDASDLQVAVYNPGAPGPAAVENLTRRFARLPLVVHVASAPEMLLLPLGRDGKPLPSALDSNEIAVAGSVGGMFFHQDRVSEIRGRMADPRRPDEMVATAEAAQLAGLRLGERVRFGAFTGQELESPTFNPLKTRPAATVSVKLVGLVVFSNQIVHDDVDAFPTYLLVTPALTRQLPSSGVSPD